MYREKSDSVMKTYSFVVSFLLPKAFIASDDIDERLGEAGLFDAHIGLGLSGRVALAFDREALSAKQAIQSAIKEVKKALPGAQLIEASPDYVGLTDMAEALGISRQAMRKHMLHDPHFPLAMHQGNPSLWHWVDVLMWAKAKWSERIASEWIEVAKVTRHLNLQQAAKKAGFKLSA